MFDNEPRNVKNIIVPEPPLPPEGAEYECPTDEAFREQTGRLCMSIRSQGGHSFSLLKRTKRLITGLPSLGVGVDVVYGVTN